MDEVFAETSVFINDDERIIVREPEYLDGLMSVLKDTPQKVVGTYMKESTVYTVALLNPIPFRFLKPKQS